MNYNSVDEILSAGITNMTVLRNNTKQDDGIDTITGVYWFTFNGIVASIIYASGNSFIGFGSSSEHLQVNRRDGAMYSLYREEGTLYNYYKFLKIRWVGYSGYNYTTSAYALTYDVILWDTGDISLHMVTIPTSYNTGTYSLVASSTYTYTVSSESPDVTFKKTNDGFEVQNTVIEPELPPEKRYLIRDGSTIYTVLDNTLSSLGDISVTSDLFLASGVNNIPDFSLFVGLTSPELLYWHEIEDSISRLVITGTPPIPQIVLYETQTISDGSVIKVIEASGSNDALFAITFDGGATWKYYDIINQVWTNAKTETNGMTKKILKAITQDQWAEIATSATFQVRCILPSTESKAGLVAIRYA